MVIAAHISSPLNSSELFHLLNFLAEKNNGTDFLFFSETGDISEKKKYSNINIIPIRPINNSLRLQFWYNYSLPVLLKKNKAHLFISEVGICSSKTGVPQLIWLGNTAFLNKLSVYREKKDNYKRKYFKKFVHKSSGVLVRDYYMTTQVLKQLDLPKEKFHYIGRHFTERYQPIDWIDKDAILNEYTDGIEYFYCECNQNTKENITLVLKAFSLFKKRLKSGLKLLLYLNNINLDECVKDFRLYKYRDDVVIKNDLPLNFMAAAYAAIHLPKEITGIGESGLTSMKWGIPFITTDTAEHNCLYKEAALFSQLTEQSIADNMMLLYKDENLRTKLIEKGLELTADYTLHISAERLWQTILASLPEKDQ